MKTTTRAASSQHSFRRVVGGFAVLFASVLLCRAASLTCNDGGTLIVALALALCILGGVDPEILHDSFLFTFLFAFLWATDPVLRFLTVCLQLTVLIWWRFNDNKCPFYERCDEARQESSENSRFMLLLALVMSVFIMPSRMTHARVKILTTLVMFLVYKIGVDMSRIKVRSRQKAKTA